MHLWDPTHPHPTTSHSDVRSLTLGARLQLLMDSQVPHTTNCASRGAISHCRQPPQHTYFTPFSGGRVASLINSGTEHNRNVSRLHTGRVENVSCLTQCAHPSRRTTARRTAAGSQYRKPPRGAQRWLHCPPDAPAGHRWQRAVRHKGEWCKQTSMAL